MATNQTMDTFKHMAHHSGIVAFNTYLGSLCIMIILVQQILQQVLFHQPSQTVTEACKYPYRFCICIS